MKTITIDIINNKALKLLQDLELLQLIRLRNNTNQPDTIKVDWASKYKGDMSKQSRTEIDNQMLDLRNGWE